MRPPLTGILRREGYIDTARIFADTLPITEAAHDLFLHSLPTIGKEKKGDAGFGKRDEGDERVRVFLNINVPSINLIASTMSFLTEQMSLIRSEHVIHHVDSIGVKFSLPNTVHYRHFPYYKFTEEITLQAVWHYCLKNKNDKVVYLHSGDYKFPSSTKIVATGPLSVTCTHLPSTCNVCGTRITPIPHPQVVGNAWLARCEYISQLADPIDFGETMGLIAPRMSHCRGVGFYAGSHWVNSHPTVRPCDVHPSEGFIGQKDTVGLGEYVPELKAAPRFPLATFAKKLERCYANGETSEQRIQEYIDIYGIPPPESWWGWSFFGAPYKSYDSNSTQS